MNYLMQALYKLGDGEHYPDYEKMQKLSQISYMENLSGKWQYVLLQGEFISHHDMFFDIFQKTYNLWRKGHDILFADIDTVCLSPIEVFGRYDDFTLFSRAPSGDLSCGFRYMPATMQQDRWDLGFRRWRRYLDHEMQYHEWDREQKIYHEMHGARPPVERRLHYILGADNDQPDTEAWVIHLPASDQPHQTRLKMEDIYNKTMKERENALCVSAL